MTTVIKSNEIETVRDYECLRNFCRGFNNPTTRNEALMHVLPNAINNYVIGIFLEDTEEASFEDCHTGINCKEVIKNNLKNGTKVTEEQLAAILNIIYIDILPLGVEMEALKLIKKYGF